MEDTNNRKQYDTEKTIKDFENFYNFYEKMPSFIKPHIDNDQKDKIDRGRAWIRRLREEEFPVAFFGSFSSGKSMTINAILGRDLLPETIKPTTVVPTIIRTDDKEMIEIHYISEQTRLERQKRLCSELSQQLGENVELGENAIDNLGDIEKDLRRRQNYLESERDMRPFNQLSKLVKEFQVREPEYISLTQEKLPEKLREYIEGGHSDVIFIDHIVVRVSGIEMLHDTVLVDLPGLGATNKLHEDITKSYIQSKAKAFVVCMKPFTLLEGEEMRFLQHLYTENKSILSRAFWIINQWDTVTPQQREEAENAFRSKIDHNFIVSRERYFKISALHSLIEQVISKEGKLNDRLRNHLNNTDKNKNDEALRKQFEADDDVKEFKNFSKSLFLYLHDTAKTDFIKDARIELCQIIKITEGFLNLFRQHYSENANPSDDVVLAMRTATAVKFYTEELKKLIEKCGREIRTNQPSLRTWIENDKEMLINELHKQIEGIDTYTLINNMRQGIDIHVDPGRLPNEFSKFLKKISITVRKMVEDVAADFSNRLQNLFQDLINQNEQYMPPELEQSLKDKLGNRDLKMRLNGLADYLLESFSLELARAGHQAQESVHSHNVNTDQERIDIAREIYKENLSKYLSSLNVDRYLPFSLKNHMEQLIDDLTYTIDENQTQISRKVAGTLKQSDSIREEIKKINQFRSYIAEFESLQSSV